MTRKTWAVEEVESEALQQHMLASHHEQCRDDALADTRISSDYEAREEAKAMAIYRRRAEMLDAFAASLRETEWQPIETAPKTARWVVVKLNRGGEEVCEVAHYAEDLSGSEQPAFRGWFKRLGSTFVELDDQPSYWMPLPDSEGK